jgi:hypothetical protein
MITWRGGVMATIMGKVTKEGKEGCEGRREVCEGRKEVRM